ncbi:hypothetical protein [Actinoallomurus sp. CA-150999]|uniref:hypothetical protein n=1 Tax=Actinoallomurus sp. CA-150999 TaxID=3239887 RepID=UPI003D8E5F04
MIARILTVLLVALTGLLPMRSALASPDDGATDGTSYASPLTALSGQRQSLVWHDTSSAADALQTTMGTETTFAAVMASVNHPLTSANCSAAESAARPVAPAATTALCWDTGDDTTDAWHPQGITTSGDADDDGAWGAYKVILSGWQSLISGRYNDARVAFVDYTNSAAPAYRWVYLVVPNATGTDFTAAKAHVGGMVWYGDKLFVTAVGNTSTAIRVFSMANILRATDSSSAIGKTSSGYAAYGYQYVMPQIGYYTYSGGTCTMFADGTYPSYTVADNDGDGTAGNSAADWVGNGTRAFTNDTTTACLSSISLDRSTSPDTLVAGEYFGHDTPNLHGRLLRYPLGSGYLLSATSGTVPVTASYRSYVGDVQGVLSYGGVWYVSHSWLDARGGIWRQTTSGGGAASCSLSGSTAHQCWAWHPEGLTYNYATGMVWGQTEWSSTECAAQSQTCGRMVFATPRTDLP